MSDRRAIRWILGLGALGLVTLSGALTLSWWSSDILARVYAFYAAQTDGNGVSEEDYQRWNILQNLSVTLQSLVTPLLIGTLIAVFALLAVLARRWDLAHRAQDEATAAS
jgi:hypothetical protein